MVLRYILKPFTLIKDHVLLSKATALEVADKKGKEILTHELITSIVALVPDEWLVTGSPFTTVEEHRKAYISFLTTRIAHSEIFVKEAQNAGK
jgi:hypothetical protein